MPELRLYAHRGEKVFAPFDTERFVEVLQNRSAMYDAEDICINGILDAAISAATGNVDQQGNPLRYSTIEFLPCYDKQKEE